MATSEPIVINVPGGGRITCVFENVERLETNLDAARRHILDKMKMQSDATMQKYEEFAKTRKEIFEQQHKKKIV